MRKTNLGRSLLLVVPLMCSPYVVQKACATHAMTIQAQTSIIKGKVVDSQSGEPIISASITVNGTKKMTITNIDGEFSIDAQVGDELVVTSLGYEKKTVKAAENMTISLVATSTMLSETVVVGYSTQKRNSLTGSLKSIDNKELTNVTTANVTNMLTGKIPGQS